MDVQLALLMRLRDKSVDNTSDVEKNGMYGTCKEQTRT